MSDVNANIGVHIDTSLALAELKALQRQLAQFHSQVSKTSAAAAAAQKNLQTNLLNSINATGKFRAQMGVVRTSTESFTDALEKNKFSMREYFRYGMGATRTFGKAFKSEFDTIGKVAQERVKRMQTQFIKMGRDANGAMKAIAVTPTTLNMKDYGNQVAVAAQKQQILNQLLRQGSTNLLNFGKNTQWAGRQLMVGFTIPLAYFGTAAAKTFMDLEAQAVKFRRVYGEMFTTTAETEKALSDIQNLAEEFTRYGVSVSKTMEMAASAAAMGKTGSELTAQVAQATRLAILGAVEQEEALKTTISLTNAFGVAAADLTSKIDFLNAVENQTVVAIEDLTIAIPKAGPVVQQLGGDVEDLAFFLTAMKEGGINASESANALKSGLASLINPSKKASEMLSDMGINIRDIVERNKGELRDTVIEFAKALDTLDPLNRARAIEQLFGKFQFARLSTLFQNVIKDGSQAARVLDLAGASVEQLAILSERELKAVEDAVGTNFKEAIEQLKVAIAPIGKEFLKVITPIAQFLGNLLEKFNGLSDGSKKFIVVMSTLLGLVGPTLLMTFGLVANGAANIIKLFVLMRQGFLKLTGNTTNLAQQTQYMTTEQMEALTVAASLNQSHARLTQQFVLEADAVRVLRNAYIEATSAAARFAAANPGMMIPGAGRVPRTPGRFARGTTEVVGGQAGKDSVLSLLMPGEAVVPTDIAQDDRFKPLISALVSGDIAKYEKGTVDAGSKKAFGHAVDFREMRKTQMSQRGQDFGFSKENLYTSIGFDVPEEINRRMNTKSANVELGEYRRAIQDKESLRTMTSRLIDAGIPPKQAISIAKEIRNNLLKSTAGLPDNTRINDDFVYKRMGNDRAGIIGALTQSKNPIVAAAVKELYFGGTRSMGGTLNLDRVLNNLKLSNPGAQRSVASINDVIKATSGKINQLALRPLEKIRQLYPDTQLEVIRDQKGNIVAFERPEVKPDNTLSKTKGAIGLLRGNKFDVERSIGSSSRKIEISKTASAAFDRLIGKKVAVKPGQKVIDLETGARVSAKRVPLTASDKDRLPAGQKLSHSKAFMLRRGQGIPALGATADDGEVGPGSKYTRTEGGLIVPKKAIDDQTKAINQNTQSQDEGRKSQDKNTTTTEKSAKEIKRDNRAMRAQRVGAISGPLAMAAGTGAMIAAMTGAPPIITNFLFGISAVAGLLPLLLNPIGALIAGLALVGVAIYKYNADIKKAREEGVAFAKSLFMSTEKIKDLSLLAGTVSATEEARRRRENIVTGSSEGQRRFGQGILESEFGKQLLGDINTQAKAGLDTKEISKNIATNLGQAVVQGVITTEQARSIASALGEKLGSYEIPALISGNLVQLLGPEGQNLFDSPIDVALRIKSESVSNAQNAFQQALDVAAANSGFAGAMRPDQSYLQGVIENLKNLIDPTTFFDEAKENQATAKVNAAAVQVGAELIGQNQQLVDGVNKQYDIKLKSAKTEQEINDIQDERKTSIDRINSANAQTLKDVLAMSQNLSASEFTKSINSAIDALYKDSSDAIKTFVKLAKDSLDKLEDSPFKKTIQLGFASGELSASTISKILEFAAADKEIESKINLLITEQGFANADLLMQLFAKTGANAQTVDIMLNYVNTNNVDFEKDIAGVAAIANMQGTYGVTLDLKTNGTQQILNAQTALSAIEKLPDRLDLALVTQLAGTDPAVFGPIKDNWKELSEGKDTINKNLIVNYSIGSVDPNITAAAKAEGVTVAEYLAKGFVAPAPAVNNNNNNNNNQNKGRDTTLDELLKRLKFIRKASIDAEGGIKELMKITSGKGLAKFGGVMQQLMAGPKGGANREFIAFLEGMDNKTRKTYMTVEKGQVVLTKQGKALKEAFNERTIGEFQVAQAQTIKDTIAQRAALLRLRAAGIDNATALEMVADASLAVAINSKSITSKELVKMGKDAKKAKDEIKDLNLAVQNLGVSVQDKITNLNTVITALSTARASGITSEELLDYIASNQDLADQIANKGINDPLVQDLIKNQPKIEDLEGAIDGLKNPLAKIQSDFDKAREKAEKFYNFLENQANAAYKKWLQDTKVTFEGVAYSIETALQKAQDKIAEYQESIDDANREVELKFDRPMEALKEQIDDIQRNIELQFDRPIEGLQREINGLQRQIEEQFDRPIEALQDESGRLSNDLSILDRAADVINKKYDAQEEALNKISELNQDIIAQEKQRISLADAISQGDISAAAQAAQDMRAAAAASAAERAGGALGRAREAEIAGLRTTGGLTRAQVEERQFQISQQTYQLEQGRAAIQAQILIRQDAIYKLEQDRIPLLDIIRGIEDEIYLLQEDKEDKMLAIRDLEDEIYDINEDIIEPINRQVELRERALQAELDAIEAQRTKWEETQAAIDAAKLKADGFDTTMAGIESKTAAMLKNWNDIQSKVVTLTTIENRISSGSASGSTVTGTKVVDGRTVVTGLEPKMYGGKVKPMAYGGRVGSDFVPSLLTPGEFVVNKFAAKRFGPLLESINGSKYPSMMGGDMMAQPSYDISSPTSIKMPVQNNMSNISNNSSSVYNYSVGITVNGTSINPNSIARNVIDQIKYIDSQRIIGQRAK